MVTPAEVDTMDDRVEAMRILSAGNTIMMLVLGAILGLQVSRDYRSRRSGPPWFSVRHRSISPFLFPDARGTRVFSRRLIAGTATGTQSSAKATPCFLRSAPCIHVQLYLWSADIYFWEQGGQEYARRVEQKELAKVEKVAKEEAVRSTSEKDKKE